MGGMVEVGWGIMACCDVVAWRLGRGFSVLFCSSRPFYDVLLCPLLRSVDDIWRWSEWTFLVLALRFSSPCDWLERRVRCSCGWFLAML